MISSGDTYECHLDMAVEFSPPTVLGAKMYKKYYKHLLHYGGGISLPLHANDHARLLKIGLPGSRILRVVARSVLLALVILSFPWLGSIVRGQHPLNSQMANNDEPSYSLNSFDYSPLFHDLTNEGLLRIGDKGLIVSDNEEDSLENYSGILGHNEIEIISSSDSVKQASIPDQTFHFVFLDNGAMEFVDRTLKVGGIATIQLNNEVLLSFQKPSNYKIVYIRRFDSTFIAMRKINQAETDLATHRRLFGFATEAKKAAALKRLENVLLEPPRASSRRSRTYLKKTKYLPDLMGDSLESYPRRVFIDVGLPEKEGGSGTGWFAKHYPTRNLDFVMYKIETMTESSGKEVMQSGMSDWLRKNVKEEEYVVMKAEAEVVEEMVKSKAIGLVNELFLECKPRGLGSKGNKSFTAYWECLALYGRLRDEGIAVHQWWG